MGFVEGNGKYLLLGLIAAVVIFSAFYVIPMLKTSPWPFNFNPQASQQASTSDCDSITSYNDRLSCINSKAVSEKDVSLCLSLSSPSKLSSDSISCIENTAKSLHKPSFCQSLTGIARIDCYKQVFKSSSKDSAGDCLSVLKVNNPNDCHTSAAVVYNDASLCKSSDCSVMFR